MIPCYLEIYKARLERLLGTNAQDQQLLFGLRGNGITDIMHITSIVLLLATAGAVSAGIGEPCYGPSGSTSKLLVPPFSSPPRN
jgi:hypothetical protein